jgi:hypothetical protein
MSIGSDMSELCFNKLGVYEGKSKGKAIPLQARTGPEGSRRLMVPVCKTVDT